MEFLNVPTHHSNPQHALLHLYVILLLVFATGEHSNKQNLLIAQETHEESL